MSALKLKCVIVGDGANGRTSFLISYTTNEFPTEVIDPETVNLIVNGNSVSLTLHEVSHHEDYSDRLRPLSYPQTDVFLVCFSVTRTDSFTNAKQLWVPEDLKFVVVGDGGNGKTCLLVTYFTNEFPVDYIPSALEPLTPNIVVDGVPVSLTLWDTCSQEGYDRLRPLCYPETDAFLVTFDVGSPDWAFTRVESNWVAEIQHHCPGVPFILVGTKCDLREKDDIPNIVTKEAAVEMAKKLGARCYMECSALKHEGLNELFEEAARAGIQYRQDLDKKKKKKNCTLL
eukprot:sb/3467750/